MKPASQDTAPAGPVVPSQLGNEIAAKVALNRQDSACPFEHLQHRMCADWRESVDAPWSGVRLD
jgi:hypothetical protein